MQRAKGSSEVTAYDNAWRELKGLEKENPRVHFSEVFNTVDYTKSQYRSAMEGLVEGAILAVLVVLLFLRDIRATLISAVAIPLSAIPAFWFMSMLGITMNFMSTMAMGLVAGVLVDDAIVEIENIVRHMRMGKSAYQASLDAADEIGLAVLATTMAIVAVFFPVALMPGIAGQYFKAFGFTVVVSVMISLFVARMITPLIAAYFLRSTALSRTRTGSGWTSTSRSSTGASTRPRAHARAAAKLAQHSLLRHRRAFSLLVDRGGSSPSATRRRHEAARAAGLPGAIVFGSRLHFPRPSVYGAGKLVGLDRRAWSAARFAEWTPIVAARWARMLDHRMAMVGAGIVTLLLSVVLFGTLPQSFFPPQNATIRGSTSRCRREARSSRPRRSTDRVAASCPRIRTLSACSSGSTSPPAGSTSSSRRTATSPAPSSSAACRRRSPRSPTRASASRARTVADRTATRATSCSISAATIRCS